MTDLAEALRPLIEQVVREVVRQELAKPKVAAIDAFLSPRAAAALADVAVRTMRRWLDEGRRHKLQH